MHSDLIKDANRPIVGCSMHDRAFLEAMSRELRARRLSLGLKQVDLAELAGCSTRFVHTAEAGKPTVRLDKLLDVLSVLGLRLRLEAGTSEAGTSEAGTSEAGTSEAGKSEPAAPEPGTPTGGDR